MIVDELVAATPQAYADLWRSALAVDLVTHVQAPNRAVDEALPWLLGDGRAARQTGREDHLWLRLLDVPAVRSVALLSWGPTGLPGSLPAGRGRALARARTAAVPC